MYYTMSYILQYIFSQQLCCLKFPQHVLLYYILISDFLQKLMNGQVPRLRPAPVLALLEGAVHPRTRHCRDQDHPRGGRVGRGLLPRRRVPTPRSPTHSRFLAELSFLLDDVEFWSAFRWYCQFLKRIFGIFSGAHARILFKSLNTLQNDSFLVVTNWM